MPQTLVTLCLILAVTLEMRGPITSVGPIADLITCDLALSASEYGLVASLPILAFGLLSFAAPATARRFGLLGAVLLFLVLLAVGGMLRAVPLYAPLLGGTFLVGTGIAALNVLMPVVIKTWYTSIARRMFGLYTGVIGLSGAIGALTAYPLADLTNLTQTPFLLWSVYGLCVLIFWQILTRARSGDRGTLLRAPSLYKKTGAWAITGVMGLQSLLIYTLAAWLPPYLAAHGTSAGTAGTALALFLLAGLPASISTERFMRACGPEWVSESLMALSYLVGLWCWTQGGAWIFLGSILAGAPQGSMLSVAFILMAEKTRSNAALLGLSAMSQGFGYLGAACGPLIFAALLPHGWSASLLFVAAIIVLWVVAGFVSSRFSTISTD